jgi:hypothetical protein
MILGVGVAVLLRRGVRAAVFHTVPCGLVFGLWYLMYGPTTNRPPGSFAATLQFIVTMTAATFEGLGQSSTVGAVIGAIALYGLARKLADARSSGGLAVLSLPLGLVAAWVGFSAITAINRVALIADFPDIGASARYVHIGAVLMLPLVALGGMYLGQSRSVLALVPVVALAFGVPGNIDALANRSPYTLGSRDLVVSVAHSSLIDDVPAGFHPMKSVDATADWLRSAAENRTTQFDSTTCLNFGAKMARGAILAFMIDGAHVLTPGIFQCISVNVGRIS